VTTTGFLIALFGALLLLALAISHRALRRALSRSLPASAKPSAYPSVTVIRPIRGLDVGATENLVALLEIAYPGEWELFCVLDSEADPAYPVVRSLVDARKNHRASRVEVLVAGPPPQGRTGKLNAMLLGAQHARGEILAFNDSDTRPGPDLLRGLVDALLSNPRAGSAFAPIVAIAEAPGAGDVGYALLVNAWYSPAVALVAGAEGELPFIMGQFMVFKRQALEAIGGVGCAEGQLVDDMYIGKRVAQAGWLNVMIKEPLPVVIGGMGMLQFLITFRRWILFSHGGLPRDFTRFNWARGVLGWGAWLLLAAALLSGEAAAAILPAMAIAAFAASQLRLQKRFGGPSVPLRYFWIAPLMPIIGAGVALSTRISRRVNWRGRSYILERGARLGSGSEAAGS
jgi:ceramide glucosyltransferase